MVNHLLEETTCFPAQFHLRSLCAGQPANVIGILLERHSSTKIAERLILTADIEIQHYEESNSTPSRMNLACSRSANPHGKLEKMPCLALHLYSTDPWWKGNVSTIQLTNPCILWQCQDALDTQWPLFYSHRRSMNKNVVPAKNSCGGTQNPARSIESPNTTSPQTHQVLF